jgi:plasmid stabilization system protein ParE
MVIFSPEADADLEQISNYIADQSGEAALNLFESCVRNATGSPTPLRVTRCFRISSTLASEGGRLAAI